MDRITISGSSKWIKPLPDFHTYVPPVAKPSRDPTLPVGTTTVSQIDTEALDVHTQEEYAWLEVVRNAVSGDLESGQYISWSAYHASHQSGITCPKGYTALLPLFEDSAHSIAMIRHSMTIAMAAIHHLNPGQIPVLACDQPLYAIAKNIQWTWPEAFGEDKLLMMFGGLHIEMAAWSMDGWKRMDGCTYSS